DADEPAVAVDVEDAVHRAEGDHHTVGQRRPAEGVAAAPGLARSGGPDDFGQLRGALGTDHRRRLTYLIPGPVAPLRHRNVLPSPRYVGSSSMTSEPETRYSRSNRSHNSPALTWRKYTRSPIRKCDAAS